MGRLLLSEAGLCAAAATAGAGAISDFKSLVLLFHIYCQ